MARSLKEIKKIQTDAFIEDQSIIELYNLTPGQSFEEQFSIVSIENILFNIVAFSILIFELMLDTFSKETDEEIAKQKIHSKKWYRQKALDFQYGFDLIDDTDEFDNSNATQEEIEASKIIKQADCVKLISSTGYGILRVKVATEVNNELAPLSVDQLNAVKYYFLRKVTDAGTQLRVTSANPDLLKLEIDVYFNPLIISSDGKRLDGSDDNPVKNKIIQYLKSLEFNGQLVLNKLENSIHDVEGIEIASNIKSAASKYGDFNYDTNNISNVGLINSVRIPDSGYMKLDEDNLVINYFVNPE